MSEVRAIFHDSVKDPADLHGRDPGGFAAVMKTIMAAAEPIVVQQRLPIPTPTSTLGRAVDEVDVLDRVLAYVRKFPPAISGEDGHGTTFRLARILWNDFGLSLTACWEPMLQWNSTLPEPWSEKELRHKLESAAAEGPGPEGRGYKLNEGKRPTAKRTTSRKPAAIAKTTSEQGNAATEEFEDSDVGHAKRYLSQRDDLRYVADQRGWYVWDGRRWIHDGSEAFVEQKIKEFGSDLTETAAKRLTAASKVLASSSATTSEKAAAAAESKQAEVDLKVALRLQSMRQVRNVVSALRSEKKVLVGKYADVFDLDPWLFNAANGTIELRTGTLRPHRREDFITKISPVAYDPDCHWALENGSSAELMTSSR